MHAHSTCLAADSVTCFSCLHCHACNLCQICKFCSRLAAIWHPHTVVQTFPPPTPRPQLPVLHEAVAIFPVSVMEYPLER